MVRGIVTKGAFYWLRAPKNSADLRNDEWVLAGIRLLLAVCALAFLAYPATAFSPKSFIFVSIAYFCYSCVVIAALIFPPVLPQSFQIYLHCLDLIWAALLTCLISWPALVFAVLFFVMVTAALRWGFWEAVLTLVVYNGILSFGFRLYQPSLASPWASMNHMELFMGFMPAMGVALMIGLLAEAKAVRSESLSMSRISRGIFIKSGLDQALHSIGSQGLELYEATQFMVAMHDMRRHRILLYRVTNPNRILQSCELDAEQHAEYLFPPPGMSIRFAAGRKRLRCVALEHGKIRKKDVAEHLPESFLTAHPFRRLLATACTLEKDWVARVYVVDPGRFYGGRAGLRHLASCVLNVSPALLNLFMVGRLTRRAKVAAGCHMARELHDGIIQSLSVIHMQLEDLRQHAGSALDPKDDPLEKIQQGIRKEIVALRDLTQQLRSLELDSGNLLSFLAGMAVKFQTENGISARFITEMKEVPLSSNVCVELARIAQEALINVRKHSNASEAYVRLNRRNGDVVLSVFDNGRGFGFSGRRSHEDLQVSGEGPRVLMERAAVIGGKVSIESVRDSGACVEVVVPCG